MSELMLREMGERIYLRRKAVGFTQEELAEKIGVSVQMISNLELGKKAIRPENLVKVSKALDISTDFILMGSERFDSKKELFEKIMCLSPKKQDLVSEIVRLCIESSEE